MPIVLTLETGALLEYEAGNIAAGEAYPAAPSGLSAQAAGETQVDLSWVANTSNESGFKIERSTDGGSTFSQIDTVGQGVTTYSDTGLSYQTYHYRVRAYNATGNSAYSNLAHTQPLLIDDPMDGDDPTPIVTPRVSPPSGIMINADTETKMFISGGKLHVRGGKAIPGWGDPSIYFDQAGGGGFERNTVFELEVLFREQTGYVMIGVSNDTVLSTANTKHALYKVDDNYIIFRDLGNDSTGQQYVFYAFPNRTYYLRLYVLPDNGCLWLIKGVQFGDEWKTLIYSETGSDAAIYPVLLNYDADFEVSIVKVGTATPPDLNVAYYNGGPDIGVDYGIGRAVSHDGFSLGRAWGNPVLTTGAGGSWDDDLVKEPFVLKDGATYKMWYSGYDGSAFRIGYATSADGVTWTKSGSNPVLDVGAGGAWDDAGVSFCSVYKDNGAAAAKRWKMLYTGYDGSIYQVGYAYSADGVTWNKGGANPVVAVGGGWDSAAVFVGALVKSGSTFYLFYEGRTTNAWPTDGQVGLVTFADFEGVYTKDAGNPIMVRSTGDAALAKDAAAGTSRIWLANSNIFSDGEYVGIGGANGLDQNRVEVQLGGTKLQLARPLIYAQDAATAHISSQSRSILPRAVLFEDSTWKMWYTAYQWGINTLIGKGEGLLYAESSDPDSGWAVSHENEQPFLLPCNGWQLDAATPWDARSSENVVWVLDADTMERVTL